MNKPRKTILIVDDFEGIREGLSAILQQDGYSVVAVSNGLEAMQILGQQTVDLVVTDIIMPEMDGFELVKKVKEQQPDMKFIMISGGGRQLDSATMPDFLKMGKRLTGIEASLKKPFKPEELLQMVKDQLSDES